jgi:hypothetical protein
LSGSYHRRQGGLFRYKKEFLNTTTLADYLGTLRAPGGTRRVPEEVRESYVFFKTDFESDGLGSALDHVSSKAAAAPVRESGVKGL